jgi:hypothetical protein
MASQTRKEKYQHLAEKLKARGIASGRGTVTTKDCIGSIDANKGDRHVLIKWDTSANSGKGEGTAYLRILSSNVICQITDRNMSNNTCQCSNAPPPVSPEKPAKESVS